jgi:hypothetical protein
MESHLREFHNSPADSSEKSAENSALSVEARHALAAWIRAKQSLERVMRREDFQSFVRPMYLIAVLGPYCFLLAMPPNKRLYERARHFRPNLRAAILKQNYDLAGICRYPSDEELLLLRDSPSFAPYVQLIWRKRAEKYEAQREAEDTRDFADLSQVLEARA